jgi:hypothetical protein
MLIYRKEKTRMIGAESLPERKDIDPISHSVQTALNKLQNGEGLTKTEKALLLTPVEVAAVLTWKKGSEVSSRYIPQMIRDKRLKPDSLAGGNSYRYKMSDVLGITFKPAGRPKKQEEEGT